MVGKGENAGNQRFLLFPQCFLAIPKIISAFEVKFILSSANASNLDQSEILAFGKELNRVQIHTKEPMVLMNLATATVA